MSTSDGIRGGVWLVVSREVTVRTRSRPIRIMTLLLVVLAVGLPLLGRALHSEPGTSAVGFTPAVASLGQPFATVATTVDEHVDVSTVDQADGEQRLRDGTLDVLVNGTPDEPQIVVKQVLSPGLSNAFGVLARQIAFSREIARLGGDPTTVAAAVDSAAFEQRTLEAPQESGVGRIIIGVLAGVLIFMALTIYGQLVAQGVVEEKSSRVVELLLTTIRPWQLMLGKVVGVGIVGLGQLLLVAGTGIGAGVATGTLSFPVGLAAGMVGWAVLWFVLGFGVFALMFAAMGALVSRQEDISGVTMPVLILLMIPYVVGISTLPSNPGSPLLTALSLVPFFAPTLMPMRIAVDVATPWEVVASLVLTAGLLVVLAWLAGRIYGNAVLRMGSRVRFRDALRSAS